MFFFITGTAAIDLKKLFYNHATVYPEQISGILIYMNGIFLLTIGIFILFYSYQRQSEKNINYIMSSLENIQVLSHLKKIENTNLIPFLKKKKKLFKSKIDYALHTDHMHYFTKKEVLEFRKNKSSKSIDPRCVICGLRLTQYRTQIQYQTMELPAYKDGK